MKLIKLHAGLCALLFASSALPAFAGEPIQYRGTLTNATGQSVSGSVDVSAGTPLPVTGTFSATTTAKANAADPTLTEGSTTNPLSLDLSGYLRSKVKVIDSGGSDATDTTNHAIRVNVVAGGAGGGSVSSTWSPDGVADGALAATTTSSNLALPGTGGTIWVQNPNTVTVF